ncbi:MAG: hypothetical protein ACI9CF_000160 [Candidatus Omnitrophota bacterium]|jgi:hypothetical protein
MKIKYIALCLAALLLTVSASGWASPRDENLFKRYQGKAVNIYIQDFGTDVDSADLDLTQLRLNLDTALSDRKSINFTVVDDVDRADIIVSARVTEFLYTDDDPIDTLMSLPMAAYDAMTKEGYSRLQANFVVSDAESQKVLWKSRVKGTSTEISPLKEKPSREELVAKAHQDVVKSFITACFAKQKKR